ncbi:DUF3883 domain-containing protein [Streptomyces sp. NPDC041003]|uniref:DUF3883 domain-containing protein n=1 Tax=Streptomyces sp. NPDC041003 TaxID=3155730 RepID=UPI00340FD416
MAAGHRHPLPLPGPRRLLRGPGPALARRGSRTPPEVPPTLRHRTPRQARERPLRPRRTRRRPPGPVPPASPPTRSRARRSRNVAAAAPATCRTEHAEQLAIDHYEKGGWTVERLGRPYDLRRTRGAEERHVEVKGTTGAATSVEPTINEVLHARDAGNTVDLYVVSDIRVAPPHGSPHGQRRNALQVPRRRHAIRQASGPLRGDRPHSGHRRMAVTSTHQARPKPARRHGGGALTPRQH